LSQELRLKIIFGLLIAIAGLLVLRSIELVLFSPLPGVAISSVKKSPIRGSIYDRDGKELAISKETYSIALNPSAIENPTKSVQLLNKELGIPTAEITGLIKDQSKSFVYLKRKAPASVAKKIRALKLKGIIIEPELDRFYPNNRLASTTLGN
jgi:cell division protein FtsI/penicillin-binding protein 2